MWAHSASTRAWQQQGVLGGIAQVGAPPASEAVPAWLGVEQPRPPAAARAQPPVPPAAVRYRRGRDRHPVRHRLAVGASGRLDDGPAIPLQWTRRASLAPDGGSTRRGTDDIDLLLSNTPQTTGTDTLSTRASSRTAPVNLRCARLRAQSRFSRSQASAGCLRSDRAGFLRSNCRPHLPKLSRPTSA